MLVSAAVGLVAGVTLTILAVVATLGVSMATSRSWGLAILARATVTDTTYSMSTGVGVLLLPLAVALSAGAAGLLASRPR